jgi:cytochrome P450
MIDTSALRKSSLALARRHPFLDADRSRYLSLSIHLPPSHARPITLYPDPVDCNPLHWTDPHTFNPSRFLPGADWNRDAFVPFSAGPRACIGRRFAEVEVVATTSLFIRDFEFILPPLRKGEDEERRKARFMMKATPAITLTPGGVDLVITKR